MSANDVNRQEDTECPTCGRTDFKSVRGMRLHHKRSHGKSLKWVTVSCTWCDDDVEKQRQNVEKNAKHFCDTECKGKWQSENVCGENHHQFSKITVQCATCSSDVKIKPARKRYYKRHFCDPECFGEWQRNNAPEGEEHHQYDRVERDCGYCGTTQLLRPSYANKRQITFCSKDCLSSWTSENQTGENNPAWKGGSDDYGDGWTEEKRERVRERDGRKCQGCGLSEKSHLEINLQKLHVHHKTPARLFDNAQKRNAMNNLVALCRSCHFKAEKMAPLYPFGN